MKRLPLLLSFHLLVVSNLCGQDWSIKRTNDFELTGKGDADAWDAAQWVSIPQRRAGGVTYSTDAKLLYSTTGIYGLFRCEDDQVSYHARGLR